MSGSGGGVSVSSLALFICACLLYVRFSFVYVRCVCVVVRVCPCVLSVFCLSDSNTRPMSGLLTRHVAFVVSCVSALALWPVSEWRSVLSCYVQTGAQVALGASRCELPLEMAALAASLYTERSGAGPLWVCVRLCASVCPSVYFAISEYEPTWGVVLRISSSHLEWRFSLPGNTQKEAALVFFLNLLVCL